MKTKKLFMLLLALIGVTGAWAQTENGSYTIDYSSIVFDIPYGVGYNFMHYLGDKGDSYVNVHLNSAVIISTGDNSHTQILHFNHAYISITCKDPAVTLISASTSEYPQKIYYPTDDSNTISFEDVSNISWVTVNYTIVPHTHNIATEWSYDNTQHWHSCTGTGVACPNNNKIDLANHEYDDDTADDATAYYTCATCGYINETRKTEYEQRDFLTMKAVGGNMTIGMTKTGSPADYDLQYSLDRIHWTSAALTATNNNIVEIATGQTCYFRHGTATAINGINTDADNYWAFTMTGTGTIEADGSIMSLLDGTTQKTDVAAFAFANLFKGCDKLTKAPKLPATTIGTRCYKGIFEETGITEAPALPAARVVKGAYENMFKNCLNLEIAPELPATRVDWTGYQDMFNGCKKIKEVTLGNITTIENGNAFNNWLTGTAEGTEGVLTAPDAMVGKSEIMSNLPSNWMFKQIRDYISAVNNALEGALDFVKAIGADYIEQIKSATSNDAAKSLQDNALNEINTLKKYGSQIEEGMFHQPTEPGMRLKVTKKDGKVYEFLVTDVESTEYYRATE